MQIEDKTKALDGRRQRYGYADTVDCDNVLGVSSLGDSELDSDFGVFSARLLWCDSSLHKAYVINMMLRSINCKKHKKIRTFDLEN